MRLTLAKVEAEHAPLLEKFKADVAATRDRVTGLIRDIMAAALPADDLDALARGLEGIDSRQTDLTAFIGEAEDVIDNAVDAARMRRMVGSARDLSELSRRISEGSQGLGRANVGLVLSPGALNSWAGVFPHSPFTGPATLDSSGDGAPLAAGLMEGQLRQAAEGFALMRKARLELDRPEDAARLWSGLDRLSWRDLDPEELAIRRCPDRNPERRRGPRVRLRAGCNLRRHRGRCASAAPQQPAEWAGGRLVQRAFPRQAWARAGGIGRTGQWTR